ncbi:uncharacterized protein LOC142223177 [Haematobia irritans]|uniref:uncharacterized protein LOC142223177 n=1 Tax=Haematobia irritans TaxID=7368 RepID=UPI003F5036D1
MPNKTFVLFSIYVLLIVVSVSQAKTIDNEVNKISTYEVTSATSSSSKVPNENNDGNASEENEYQLTPKDQLLYFTLIAFRDISIEYVDLAANISEKLLKDVDLKAGTSATLDEFRKNISDFLDQYKKYEGIEELFNLVDLYSNTTTPYFGTPNDNASADMLKIQKKLKSYGSADLDEEFEDRFMKFSNQFCEKFEEFKSKLNAEELQKEKKMFEWMNEFKPIQNAQEKILSFETFFRFFEE